MISGIADAMERLEELEAFLRLELELERGALYVDLAL